jgi:hypothetical protein
MAPRHILLVSSGSKKKEPRYTCLREAKASHSQRMWTEVSSSAQHLLHNGLSDSPIRWRCFLRVLCPVRRPVTVLDWILLKDRNLALAPRQGLEINSGAGFWVIPRPRHLAKCWLSIQRCIFLLMFCLETPKAGSDPTKFLNRSVPCELVGDSFSSCPSTSRDPIQPNRMRGRDIIQHLLALLDHDRGKEFHFSTKCTDPLYGLQSLLLTGYQDVKLTSPRHLLSRFRIEWSYNSNTHVSFHGVDREIFTSY